MGWKEEYANLKVGIKDLENIFESMKFDFVNKYGGEDEQNFNAIVEGIQEELKQCGSEINKTEREINSISETMRTLGRKIEMKTGLFRTIENRVNIELVPEQEKLKSKIEKRAKQFEESINLYAEQWNELDYQILIKLGENPEYKCSREIPKSLYNIHLFGKSPISQPTLTVSELLTEAEKLEVEELPDEYNTNVNNNKKNLRLNPFLVVNKRIETITGKLEKVKGNVEKLINELGDPEELKRKLSKMTKDYNDMELNYNALKDNIDIFKNSYLKRKKFFIASRETLKKGFGMKLSNLGSKMGLHKMDIDFDDNKGQLEIKFSSDAAVQRINTYGESDERTRSTATLSGGEGSFLSMCILLTCWRLMDPPIIVVDEWDVFLDSVRRKEIVQSMLDGLKDSNCSVILISPNRVTEEEKGDRSWVDERHVEKKS